MVTRNASNNFGPHLFESGVETSVLSWPVEGNVPIKSANIDTHGSESSNATWTFSQILFLSINQVWKYWNRARFHHVLYTSKIASNWGLHCSRFLRPMWRKERRSFSFTCGCRSWRETLSLAAFFNCAVDFTWKQFLIFFKISGFNCETMDPPVHESFEVPERKKYNQNLLIRTGYRMSQL